MKTITKGMKRVAGLALSLCMLGAAESAAYTGEWVRKADVYSIPNGPASRSWSDMVYDSARGEMVIFGGSSSTYLNDLWSYETLADQWTMLLPVVECDPTQFHPPTQRDEHAFEYDPYNDLYWTFGGSGYHCTGDSSIAEAGSDTVTLVDSTLTETRDDYYVGWTVHVKGRKSYVQSYDASTRTLHLMTPNRFLGPGASYLLYAQRGGGTFHYSRPLDQWTGFESPYWGYTGSVPLSRFAPGFAYSDADQAIVMFGGRVYNDTWAMDVRTQTWVKMNSSGDLSAPPKRREIHNSMAYDRAHDVFVLFGGSCTDNPRCTRDDELADTWIYNLKTNTWTEMTPAVSPAKRQQHNLVYDPHNGVIVMYGGRDGSLKYNDLWVYDVASNTWTEVVTNTLPPARSLTTFAYDEVNRVFVLYGGSGSQFRDVWHLSLNSGGGNAAPVAVLDVTPASGDVSTNFAFDGSRSSDSDGTVVSYSWDFGDGTGTNGVNVNHQYGTAGTYTVRLTATDNGGATGSATTSVTVSAVAEPLQLDVSGATLRGSVNDPSINNVTVNGVSVPVDAAGNFEAPVDLAPGVTNVTIQATGANGTATSTVTVTVE